MKIFGKAKFNVIVVLVLLLSPVTAFADAFCDGFEHGYKSGFMQSKGTSLAPLTPLCPLEPLKKLSDPKSDYEHGYIIGFRKGTSDGSR